MAEQNPSERTEEYKNYNSRKYLLHPVKSPVELIPDSESYRPVVFREMDTGKSHELFIESVTLFDPYREIQEFLNTPGLDRDAQADIAMIMTDHMIRHANDAPRYEICYNCEDAQIVFTERGTASKDDIITANPAFSNALAFLGASVYTPDDTAKSLLEPNGTVGGRQTCIIQYTAEFDGRLELLIDSCFS